MNRTLCLGLLLVLTLSVPKPASAELRFASIFGDSMVLQRDRPIRVWGWTNPGQEVVIELAGHQASATADATGRFEASIDPLPAGGPHKMTVKADQQRVFEDVLIGDVWICSGQSNMAWEIRNTNDADLEALSANYPNIRLISVPRVGTQEPQDDFEGSWEACSPETVNTFSAVGYLFGRQIHQTVGVPIGLIDNAWGGSAADAWIDRPVMEADGRFDELMDHWKDVEASIPKQMTAYENRKQAWIDGGRKGRAPRNPNDQLTGNQRPGNIYNGVLYPTIGYTIKGAIWYQGESNASRAYQYRDLFPLMIQHWRDKWQQGDFPFYWVQLADFRDEVTQPGESDWAELREAQTMTMDRLPNTGEAVIINTGEASDIHPRNKQDVAKRLARWALAKDYGIDIAFQSPRYESMEVMGNKVRLTFRHVGGGLDTFDVRDLIGFTIAGADKKFVAAEAKFVATKGRAPVTQIDVSSPEVESPAAVRYAWANNPVCNLQSAEGLPMTPFRTDDWPGITVNTKHR